MKAFDIKDYHISMNTQGKLNTIAEDFIILERPNSLFNAFFDIN